MGNFTITYHENRINSHIINFISLLKALLMHICPIICATLRFSAHFLWKRFKNLGLCHNFNLNLLLGNTRDLLRAHMFPIVQYYLLCKFSHFLIRKHAIIKRNRRQDNHMVHLFKF